MSEIARPQRPENVYFFGTCVIDLFYPGAVVWRAWSC